MTKRNDKNHKDEGGLGQKDMDIRSKHKCEMDAFSNTLCTTNYDTFEHNALGMWQGVLLKAIIWALCLEGGLHGMLNSPGPAPMDM